ncbi:hypothetical protein [Saccharopolyspora sp. NPDC049357]|uniref:hypothetical protein n=1 Tax=Saccharopolyspora sp. NPDC049357 TaxID=3154507 RepID=UPI003419DC60
MSQETANAIALWILVPSLILVVVITVGTALGTPRGVRDTRRERQMAQLDQGAAQERVRQHTFQIDWLDYREISKPEIVSILSKHGWAYRDEELGDKEWLLRFDLSSTRNRTSAGQG